MGSILNHDSIVGAQVWTGQRLEALLEDLINEAVADSQVKVQVLVVAVGVARVVHPPYSPLHVLSPVVNEGLDLLPSLHLVGSLAAELLVMDGNELLLQALQHIVELGLCEVLPVHPAGLDAMDVLVGVTVEVLELFDLRAGGEGEFVRHGSIVGSGCGQGNA